MKRNYLVATALFCLCAVFIIFTGARDAMNKRAVPVYTERISRQKIDREPKWQLPKFDKNFFSRFKP